jgi:hemerythrin
MALSWDPTLVTGVPEVDAQHEQLFERLDALLHAIRRGSSRDEVARTLAFLRDYVDTHFAAEEALMRDAAYGGYEEHKAQHELFARDLAALQEEFRRDGPSPSLILRVNSRVTAWLRDHLHRLDRSLADHLRATRR